MAKTHDLEGFIERTIAANTKWVLEAKDKLPTPIKELYLWSAQGRLEVTAVIISGGGKTHEVTHGDVPPTTLPLNDAEDELLVAFREKHDIDEDDLAWGDYDGMPEALYRMEMIHAAKEVAARLKKAGVAFAKDAEIGIRIEDEDYTDAEDFLSNVRAGLADLGEGVARGLLGLYYKNPTAQEQLLEGLDEDEDDDDDDDDDDDEDSDDEGEAEEEG